MTGARVVLAQGHRVPRGVAETGRPVFAPSHGWFLMLEEEEEEEIIIIRNYSTFFVESGKPNCL